MKADKHIESRKQAHVELCLNENVGFRSKTAGFESVELEYCALPEIDLAEVQTSTLFAGRPVTLPLLLSSMTGGYERAEHINRELAEVCEEVGIAMGVGSQRQALQSNEFHSSFATVRKHAPSIPIIANIGAAELAQDLSIDELRSLIDLIEADVLAVHLNPLQELLQPEGTPRFRGVLQGIERVVRELEIPVCVKEVGAGISASVARRLLDAGVQIIDVAGAGGTSWAGVELLRSEHPEYMELWDCGIPTVQCLREVQELKTRYSFTLLGSGGLRSGYDLAKCIALGADIAAAARPFLKKLVEDGQSALHSELEIWQRQLRAQMFVCGAASIADLQAVRVRSI